MDWISLKDEAARMVFEKDALHIYAALFIQIAAAKLSRRSLGHVLPWLSVLGLELVNEMIDLWRGGESRLMPWQVVSAAHDLINTMAVPTILLLLCRRAPELFDWRRGEAEAEARASVSDGRSAPMASSGSGLKERRLSAIRAQAASSNVPE